MYPKESNRESKRGSLSEIEMGRIDSKNNMTQSKFIPNTTRSQIPSVNQSKTRKSKLKSQFSSVMSKSTLHISESYCSKCYHFLSFIIPNLFDLYDKISNVLYVFLQDFGENQVIKDCIIFFIFFGPIVQYLVWCIFLSEKFSKHKYEKEWKLVVQDKQNNVYSRSRTFYYLTYLKYRFLMSLEFIFYFIISLPYGFILTILVELKFGTLLLGCMFKWKNGYFLTQSIMDHYQQTKERNDIDEVGEQNHFFSIQRQNSWYEIFTKCIVVKQTIIYGELVQTIFQGMPQLVLQYINNELTDDWDDPIAFTSFYATLIVIFINSITISGLIFNANMSGIFEIIKKTRKNKEFLKLQKAQITVKKVDDSRLISKLQTQSLQKIQSLSINYQNNKLYIDKLLGYLQIAVSNGLKNIDNLTVNFNNVKLSQFQTQILNKIIKSFKQLKYLKLYLHKVQLGDEGCLELATAFMTSNLKQLDLDFEVAATSKKKITSIGITQLGFQLEKCDLQNIKLNLNGNNIQDEGVIALFNSLENNNEMTHIDFSFKWNNISKIGGVVIGKQIKKNRLLQNVNINFFSNQLEKNGAMEIGNALQANKFINTLNINLFNNDIKTEGAISIFKALEINKNMSILDLNFGKNQIEDGALEIMKENMFQCMNIKDLKLNLDQNSITKKGANYIAQAIASQELLCNIQVYIQKNYIQQEGIDKIIDSVCYHKQLESVKLDFEDNQGNGVSNIYYLKKLRNLKALHLNFNKNKFTNQNLNQISDSLFYLNDLKEFSLEISDQTDSIDLSAFNTWLKTQHLKQFILNLNENQVLETPLLEMFEILLNTRINFNEVCLIGTKVSDIIQIQLQQYRKRFKQNGQQLIVNL